MDFVSGMATMDDERGRHLAAMFLDQGLWYFFPFFFMIDERGRHLADGICVCV
jgi:hypothetical protein